MDEYIKRQALIKAYVDLCLARSRLAKSRKGAAFFQGDLLPETELTDKEWMRLINATPTVDAVEVVRCKDCKYYKFGKHFTDIKFCQRLPLYAAKGGLNTADVDFCSHGERREDDG